MTAKVNSNLQIYGKCIYQRDVINLYHGQYIRLSIPTQASQCWFFICFQITNGTCRINANWSMLL